VSDAIHELVHRSDKTPAIVINEIAEYLNDKPKYIEKLYYGVSFPSMKKAKNLVYFRPRLLKRMTKNYQIEENDLAGVPEGGCTLHYYLFERKRSGTEEETSKPTKKEPNQIPLPFEMTPENILKSLLRSNLRFVVFRDQNGAVRAVMLASNDDLRTYALGGDVELVSTIEGIQRLIHEDSAFLNTIWMFSNFRA
jgi:hypothetical protein